MDKILCFTAQMKQQTSKCTLSVQKGKQSDPNGMGQHPCVLVNFWCLAPTGTLGCDGVAALGEAEHRALLHYLCDEALDREGMRDHLQYRLDSADAVKKDMREIIAEDKGKLKVRDSPLPIHLGRSFVFVACIMSLANDGIQRGWLNPGPL
jgi:hypothetical protein